MIPPALPARSAPVAVISAAQIATLAPPAPAVAAGRARQGARAAADHARAPDPARRAPPQPRSATRASVRWARVGRTARCGSSSSFLVPFLLAFADAARRVARGVESRGRGLRPPARKAGLARSFSNFPSSGRLPARQTLWKEKGLMKRILAVVAAMLGLLVSAGYASATPPGDPAAQALGQAAASGQAAGALSGASQSQPANQNISVRVLSPGNNGDVSQSNTAARTPRQGTRTSPASRPARPRTARADARAERKRSARTRTTASPHKHCRTPRRVARATRTSQSGS